MMHQSRMRKPCLENNVTAVDDLIDEIKQTQEDYVRMAHASIRNRDWHGIMDAGAELQALDRALKELEKLTERK
jgi:hypothetical protein